MHADHFAAPPSTNNGGGERYPEMHPTKKGNQRYFGMTLHVGVAGVLGLTHGFEGTAANRHDLTLSTELLHGADARVWGDAGY